MSRLAYGQLWGSHRPPSTHYQPQHWRPALFPSPTPPPGRVIKPSRPGSGGQSLGEGLPLAFSLCVPHPTSKRGCHFLHFRRGVCSAPSCQRWGTGIDHVRQCPEMSPSAVLGSGGRGGGSGGRGGDQQPLGVCVESQMVAPRPGPLKSSCLRNPRPTGPLGPHLRSSPVSPTVWFGRPDV